MNGGFVGELEAIAPRSPAISYHSSPANLGRRRRTELPPAPPRGSGVRRHRHPRQRRHHAPRARHSTRRGRGNGPRRGGDRASGPRPARRRCVRSALDGTDLERPITNERLSRLGRRLRDEKLWFHLGTHPDWSAVYFDELRVERLLMRASRRRRRPVPGDESSGPRRSARQSPRARWPPIPAANVAGCCQVFRRELLDEIGFLVDEFSPYGYEDVEFCIRAARAPASATTSTRGSSCCTAPIGATSSARHRRRTIATHRNFMRCKALLAWHHARPSWQVIVERSILRRYALARQVGRHRTAVEHLRAHVAGSLDAQRQIRHAYAPVGERR